MDTREFLNEKLVVSAVIQAKQKNVDFGAGSVRHFLSRMPKDYYLPLGLMLGIFLLSSIPGDVHHGGFKFLADLNPQLQNLLHIPLFGLLQWLWLHAMHKSDRLCKRTVLVCCGVSLGYGAFDEFHQMFVPGRYASLTDMALNLVGVMVATLLFWVWQRYAARGNLVH